MDMRGLAHFIQDVRKATSSPTEERKRVDLELVKIRSKFRNTATMSTYDRKKYVCKLMFIAMLGYPVEFGHMEGVKLLALKSPAEKLIGYLSVTVFLHENHPLLILATHMIYKDLLSEQELNMSLALTAIGNAGGKDFAEVMSTGVKEILLNERWNLHIRKKALLTYLRMYRKCPDIADLTEVIPVVTELILSPLFGMSGCAVIFLTGCFNEVNSHLFSLVPQKVIELLGRIILAKQTEPGYVYYGVPAPWLQASSMKLLRKFPPPTDPQLKEKSIHVLQMIVRATDKVLRDAQTQQKQKGTINRVSAMNAVFFEVFLLVIEWNLETKLRIDCLDVLTSFVTEKKESNLRYLGFSLLSKLCSSKGSRNEYKIYCKQYQQQIVVALHDPDVSIRTKALDVAVSMCDADSATEVIKELVSYLIVADGSFKESLVLAIAHLAEKYCSDYGWYVDTIVSVIAQAGILTPQKIIYRVVHVIINNSYVQKRAASNLFNILKTRKTVPDVLLRVAAIILGEFGYQIALNAESTPFMQVTVLQNHLNDASDETQCLVLSTFVKFYNYYDANVREKILKILRTYRNSFNVELQQRSLEYVGLIEMGNDELIQKMLEPLPIFEGDKFSTCMNGISREGADFIEPLVEKKTKMETKNVTVVSDVTNGVISPSLLEINHDIPSKIEGSKDSIMESLFHVNSPIQLEKMSKENEVIKKMFISLLTNLSGILYSDEYVELYCEQYYRGPDARLTVKIKNKTKVGLCNVIIEIIGVDAGLLLQSRNNQGDISPGEFLKVEFVARSWAPYQQAPTLRLCYEVMNKETNVMKFFSLPIITSRFLCPYDEQGEEGYNILNEQLNSISPDIRELAQGSFINNEIVEKALNCMNFRIFHRSNSNEWKAIAAHATQPNGILSFIPIVVHVVICGEGAAKVKILSKSSILQDVIFEVLQQLVHSMKEYLSDQNKNNKVSNSFNTEDIFQM